MNDEHDSEQLAAYMVKLLDADDARSVEAHLVRCEQCRYELDELRMLDKALDHLPPEALLNGPPPDGDLLLQRMVRQVRQESAAPRSRRQLALVAAAVVAIAAVGAGSAVLGRTTAPETIVAAPAAPAPAASALSPNSYVLAGVNPETGSAMTVTVSPAAGWVRLSATVEGVPAGEECLLVAVAQDGSTQIAGSWLVSPAGEADGTTLAGAALVAPDDLVSVRVENFDGREFVTVST